MNNIAIQDFPTIIIYLFHISFSTAISPNPPKQEKVRSVSKMPSCSHCPLAPISHLLPRQLNEAQPPALDHPSATCQETFASRVSWIAGNKCMEKQLEKQMYG